MHSVVFYALDVVNSVFPCLLPVAMPSFGGGEWKFGIMTLRAMTEALKIKTSWWKWTDRYPSPSHSHLHA